MNLIYGIVIALVTAVSYVRWWRVAQREHYAPGRVFAILVLWIKATPINGFALFIVALGAVISLGDPLVGIVFAVWWLLWPHGLALFSANKLAITDRVKRLIAITAVLHVVVAAVLIWQDCASVLPLAVTPITEISLLVARPLEARLASKWQVQAAETLRRVHPRVVAITGSYGKTSTKNYAAHLMAGRWSVLPSPASFNNAMGLSKAINDRLVPGTDVFLAEMGTYGPGEIAGLTTLFPPDIAAITTIGEAHLERMKNRETIVRAKSEIVVPAKTVVLNVDVPELAALADRLAATKRVIRCSVTEGVHADVSLIGDRLFVDGIEYDVVVPVDVDHPSNLAIAVGLSLAADVPIDQIVARIDGVPTTPHRAESQRREDGLVVIDDTFNSNPTGAAAALSKAKKIAGETGRVWTITPGMVELGSEQSNRNADFAVAATQDPNMTLCVVGRTNRKALLAGEKSRTYLFASRQAATDYVMRKVTVDDVVLYENDLPDHYA